MVLYRQPSTCSKPPAFSVENLLALEVSKNSDFVETVLICRHGLSPGDEGLRQASCGANRTRILLFDAILLTTSRVISLRGMVACQTLRLTLDYLKNPCNTGAWRHHKKLHSAVGLENA